MSVATAGLYSWKDQNGVIHFSDDMPVEKSKVDKDSGFNAIIESGIYSVPIFNISNAIDPSFEFSGKYFPVEPNNDGFPEYRLKRKMKLKRRERGLTFSLTAVGYRGKWQWVLEQNNSEKYFSNFVAEGTPPDNVKYWKDKASGAGNFVSINVHKEIVTLRSEHFEHLYFYDHTSIPEGRFPWMKKQYMIHGLPIALYNGTYPPVNWTSSMPRYSKSDNILLVAENFGEQWVWKIIKITSRQETIFSSDRVDRGVFPQNVKKWFEVRGKLYIPVEVKELPVQR